MGAASEEDLAIHPGSRAREALVEIDLDVQKVEKPSVHGKGRLVDGFFCNEQKTASQDAVMISVKFVGRGDDLSQSVGQIYVRFDVVSDRQPVRTPAPRRQRQYRRRGPTSRPRREAKPARPSHLSESSRAGRRAVEEASALQFAPPRSNGELLRPNFEKDPNSSARSAKSSSDSTKRWPTRMLRSAAWADRGCSGERGSVIVTLGDTQKRVSQFPVRHCEEAMQSRGRSTTVWVAGAAHVVAPGLLCRLSQ